VFRFLLPLAVVPILLAQPPGPPPGERFDKTRMGKGDPDAAGMRPNRGPWWEGALASDIKLTDAQRKQILQTRREFRGRMFDLRTAVNKAEADLAAAFNDDPIDQRKTNEAIERLVTVRGELFRATSQMDLRMRSVLTAEQWRELQNRQRPRPDWPNPRRRPAPGGATTPPGANQQK
jgi:Spy/CpxP family protein refolding chaperone